MQKFPEVMQELCRSYAEVMQRFVEQKTKKQGGRVGLPT
jgi:hypothetical protein